MRARLILFAVLMALGQPVGSETPNLSPGGAAEMGAAARLVLAQQVYEAGLSDGDPVLLISAIRLAREVTLRPPAGWSKVTEGDAAPDAPDGKAGAPDPAGPGAIAIARGLAGDDPDLQDLVFDLDAQLPHGRRPTAIHATAVLDPGQTDTWTLVLAGETAAEIGLIGDGDTDLALSITDESGASICARPAGAAPSLCRFTPARNGFFAVQVRNLGQIRNSYRLVGN